MVKEIIQTIVDRFPLASNMIKADVNIEGEEDQARVIVTFTCRLTNISSSYNCPVTDSLCGILYELESAYGRILIARK